MPQGGPQGGKGCSSRPLSLGMAMMLATSNSPHLPPFQRSVCVRLRRTGAPFGPLADLGTVQCFVASGAAATHSPSCERTEVRPWVVAADSLVGRHAKLDDVSRTRVRTVLSGLGSCAGICFVHLGCPRPSPTYHLGPTYASTNGTPICKAGAGGMAVERGLLGLRNDRHISHRCAGIVC